MTARKHQVALRLEDAQYEFFSELAWRRRVTRSTLAWQIVTGYLDAVTALDAAQHVQEELPLGIDPANRDNE